jgi:hypothetical protein
MSATEPGVDSQTPGAEGLDTGGNGSPSGSDPEAGLRQELESRRERLTERFALLQSELGGLFYEMAIRDHLQLDLLIARAAALQRVDDELRQVERELVRG